MFSSKTMEDFMNVNFGEWLNELKIGRLKKSILMDVHVYNERINKKLNIKVHKTFAWLMLS